jgi:hypothetical protein
MVKRPNPPGASENAKTKSSSFFSDSSSSSTAANEEDVSTIVHGGDVTRPSLTMETYAEISLPFVAVVSFSVAAREEEEMDDDMCAYFC